MSSRNKKTTQPIEGELITAGLTPVKLSSIKDVRLEMAAVYRQTRSGRLEPQTATRLTYILVQVGNMIRDSELERRIQLLEEANEQSRTKNF